MKRHLLPQLSLMPVLFLLGCGGSPSPTTGDQSHLDEANSGNRDGTSNGGAIGSDNSGHITICHFPPGNRPNAHTITVGAPAVAAHIANHGDHLGPCTAAEEPDGGSSGGAPDAGQNPDGGQGGDQDAGTCQPQGSACGLSLPACCTGFTCVNGTCASRLG